MDTTQESTTTRPVNDAYTGMLAISLFALLGGCVLLYLDYSQYPDSKAPAIPKAPGVPVVGGGEDVNQANVGPPSKKAKEEPSKEKQEPEPDPEKK